MSGLAVVPLWCRVEGRRALWLVQVKRAIEKGNIEGARIYAQNAIRKKTEQLNYLKVWAPARLRGPACGLL